VEHGLDPNLAGVFPPQGRRWPCAAVARAAGGWEEAQGAGGQ
jgi:hypothetical protein